MSGDGSAAHPWSTLAEVLDPANKLVSTKSHSLGFLKGTDTALHPTNPDGPISAGDVILLMSGNHGSPQLTNMFNSDFITVAAAPKATPVVGAMKVVSSSKWLFQGLTFEGMATTAVGASSIAMSNRALVSSGTGDWIGQSSQIIFDNDTFRASSSTSGWNDYDWYNKPYSLALSLRSPCSTVTGSHFYNILTGVFVDQPRSLIQGNTIEYFSNDGIELSASYSLVKNNIIRRGAHKSVNPLHADGIQGWSAIVNGQPVTNLHVLIDGNLITKTGDPDVSYMQGISIYDGKWNDLVVQNNVVNVNAWNGIAIWGAQYPRILNNTVIGSAPADYPSWIIIHDGKDGAASTGVIHNNIATSIVAQRTGNYIDHNIVAQSFNLPTGIVSSGTTGMANMVLPRVLDGFVTSGVSDGTFDGRIKATSVAVGAGVLANAPPLDKAGNVRTDPVDVGALNH